ncbi:MULTISPECIES: CcoQ/FixQ family Cbb3-type cytochrome c oxidase assembly chaperone [unclassified Flavobacterium]|uniref:CcoQ/FixQ family Cbb3-type cytochrome c oxidase assembly chaperone n=1 Tax=unclassified Flavobacterium TaxID=196869 RepID=UPI00361BCFB1
MLKFVKHTMENISGIEIYPILSLLIFFFFFVGLYCWVFTYNKEKITQLGNLPFAEGTTDESLK